MKLLFFETLDISQGSVAIHLRCTGSSVIVMYTNFLLILMFKQIGYYLVKLRLTRNVIFWPFFMY